MPERTLPLTLILPVHERQAVLDRALASIAGQTVPPQEVIVVDDGSRAEPLISSTIRARVNVRLVRHAANKGVAAARNTGLRLAQTAWVTFLDSDDWLVPDSLETRWHAVRRKLDAGASERTVFGCGWWDVRPDGRVLGLRWPRRGSEPWQFASGCWFSPGSCVILQRTIALETAGLQDEALRRLEDVDWFLALALQGFTFEPLPVASVGIERSRARSVEMIEASAATLREKWRERLGDRRLSRRLDAYLDLEIAAARYFSASRLAAVRPLVSSFMNAPRLTLQLSPGWDVQRADGMVAASVLRSAGDRHG